MSGVLFFQIYTFDKPSLRHCAICRTKGALNNNNYRGINLVCRKTNAKSQQNSLIKCLDSTCEYFANITYYPDNNNNNNNNNNNIIINNINYCGLSLNYTSLTTYAMADTVSFLSCQEVMAFYGSVINSGLSVLGNSNFKALASSYVHVAAYMCLLVIIACLGETVLPILY